jgi:hypothetical protein
MNNFIKQVIEEKFASKAQQRFFYAKAKGGKNKKWSKWAKEFSDKTDYSKIPDKVEKEQEVDEIVDKNGNIATGKMPTDFNTKGIGDEWTTDEVVKTAAGSMGTHGVHGTHTSLRYWAEGKLTKEKLIEIAMGDALGFEETMGEDEPYKKAFKHFTEELGLSDEEAKERLEAMGYIPGQNDVVRLVENPLSFMEDYIEDVLKKKKQKDNDLLMKDKENEVKEVHPIVKRQIMSLKNSMKSHGLNTDDVLKHLEDEDNE